MANRVEEIMNRELFSLRPDDAIDEALEWILMLGISGAPVTDPYVKPVGMASWRDLLAHRRGPTVGDCMSSPALVVDAQFRKTALDRLRSGQASLGPQG